MKSSEVHTYDIEVQSGPELPFATHNHCMVQFRHNQFMLIGYDKTVGIKRNRYFIYDISSHKWLPEIKGSFLPKSGTGKQHCAAFKTEGKTKIFLSGYAYVSSFYDVSTGLWSPGPKLPVERSGYVVVANPEGDGILMLGGYKSGKQSNEVWQMKCATKTLANQETKTDCKWTRQPFKLPTARSSFTAFYVPEKSMSCE